MKKFPSLIKNVDVACFIVLAILAIVVSSSYRGIFSDDTRGYVDLGEFVYTQHCWDTEDGPESVASILYPLLISAAFPFFGRTVMVSHFFPFLLAIITPLLFYLLLREIFQNSLWAFGGSLLFLFYPTNIAYLNQNLTEPVFVFCAVLTMLLLEYAKKHPKLFVAVGIAASLMVLARLFCGLLFSAILALTLLYHAWKKTLRIQWVLWFFAAFAGVQLLSSFVLQYSFVEYWHYFEHMQGSRNLEYSKGIAATLRTKAAIRSYAVWYFGGKAIPLFGGLFLAGVWYTTRRRILYPVLLFSFYSLFLFLGLGGRQIEPYLLRLAVKVLPALVLLLVAGGRACSDLLGKKHRFVNAFVLCCGILILGWVSYKKNLAYFYTMANIIIPPTSFGQILRQNPPIPTHEEELRDGINLPEEIYKEVLGAYRPSYLSKLAQKSFQKGEPQQLQQHSDFAYHDDFTDGERWRNDIWRIEGDTQLWTAKHPKHLGAFPAGSGGSITYKFSFSTAIDDVWISDIHTQWRSGDRVQLWTSGNGRQWDLRHDYDLRLRKVYYHQHFDNEFDGLRVLYIKYTFYAGDSSRDANDNRGASLRELFLAVNVHD